MQLNCHCDVLRAFDQEEWIYTKAMQDLTQLRELLNQNRRSLVNKGQNIRVDSITLILYLSKSKSNSPKNYLSKSKSTLLKKYLSKK